MARLASTGSRVLSVTTLLLSVLFPCAASAGWGDENWGEMVWGRAVIPVPSMSIEGLIALTILLVLVSGTLFTRQRRRAKP
jgi:hypothetical protein